MKILIFGGGGFLGRKLAATLLQLEELAVNGRPAKRINKITLFDKQFPADLFTHPKLEVVEGDIYRERQVRSLLLREPEVIFHLAAVVSGEAEKDFDLGMEVNLKASWQIMEICRELAYKPVFVFTSSCAVFANVANEAIYDDTASLPKSSYGTQKAMVDLLINDYSRKGFINGRALRLPTIVVRPGKPNAATTSFVSSIIREPLQGERALCPVAKNTPLWVLSPKRVVENFIHAAGLPEADLGANRLINLPGITVTVEEMLESLALAGGEEAVKLVDFQPDDFIQNIVLTFPAYFVTERAIELGFKSDDSFEDIIQGFIEEELG